MPVISNFNGIIIKMYYQQSEHNPPHVHAFYAGDVESIEIKTGRILEGYLPQKQDKLAKEWVSIHREELLQMWESQQFVLIASS